MDPQTGPRPVARLIVGVSARVRHDALLELAQGEAADPIIAFSLAVSPEHHLLARVGNLERPFAG